ncbi:MAG: hypothetical protein RL150_111, partial [Candidatus Parcubacteria bacterium]
MPFLVRIIAQRLFLVGLSLLTFVGVEPNLDIQTTEEAQVATEERKELIGGTLETIASDAAEATEPLQTLIPLPRINIFDIPYYVPETPNITTPDATKSQPPVIEPVPIKTTIPTPTPTPTPTKTASPPPTKTPEQTPPKTETTPTDTSSKATVENTVVSILCVRHNGSKIHVTTGSGVIISSKGVVLTNSHVAQMFLLKDAGYDCSIRRENIPTYGFTAIPLF